MPFRLPGERERRRGEREEGEAAERSGENRERQKETGFLGTRMVVLNRHLGRGGNGRDDKRESDSRGIIWEIPMPMGLGKGIGASNI